MGSMFQGCSALTTIYVSVLWNTTKVGTSGDMFTGCSNIKGGNGTTYNAEFTDKDYARIDAAGTPGYLTGKAITTLQLGNDADNTSAITACNGKTLSVQLIGRTLIKDGCWNTLCLPFDLTIAGSILEGAAAIKEFDPETKLVGKTLKLYFKDARFTIPAGTPFIIKWTSGENIVNPTFTGVTISGSAQTVTSNDTKVQFVGTYSPFAITAENIDDILYIGSANKIGYSKSARTLKSCRAHFYIPATASARAVSTIDFIDDEATGVVLIDNGELIMNNEAGVWYTLDGRRLSSRPTTKGIYIHNGKKEAIR